jgi:hypothetical protein
LIPEIPKAAEKPPKLSQHLRHQRRPSNIKEETKQPTPLKHAPLVDSEAQLAKNLLQQLGVSHVKKPKPFSSRYVVDMGDLDGMLRRFKQCVTDLGLEDVPYTRPIPKQCLLTEQH